MLKIFERGLKSNETFCYQRLQFLDAKWRLHDLLNGPMVCPNHNHHCFCGFMIFRLIFYGFLYWIAWNYALKQKFLGEKSSTKVPTSWLLQLQKSWHPHSRLRMYESEAFAQIYQEDSRYRRQYESLQERWKRNDFERSFWKVHLNF